MTALAYKISRISGIDIEAETLKTIAIFCASGLLASVVLGLTYGLDMSPGFF